jgi:hypothetical protein
VFPDGAIIRGPIRGSFAAVAALMLVTVACTAPAHDQAASASPTAVSVAGVRLDQHDVVGASMLMLSALDVEHLERQPARMPAFASYAWYAGAGPDGKPVVWIVPHSTFDRLGESAQRDAARQLDAAYVMAGMARALSDRNAAHHPKLVTMYAARSNPKARFALALQIVDAVHAASANAERKAIADSAWIVANVRPGLTRSEAYALLDAHGLHATDYSERTTRPAFGTAYVSLPGKFGPGCGTTRLFAILFDPNDRVDRVNVGSPEANCL